MECKVGITDEYRRILADGINRNIVECKDKYQRINPIMSHVLIETLWNVKLLFYGTANCSKSINRNIVECKVTYSPPVNPHMLY